MRSWVALAVAGSLGVLARHAVQTLVPRTGGVPWGTLLVNISGAFLIGFVAGLVAHRLNAPMWVQQAITVGFLGGYTTFSTLALESVLLLDQGRTGVAFGYTVGTLAVGILAVVVGGRLGRVM